MKDCSEMIVGTGILALCRCGDTGLKCNYFISDKSHLLYVPKKPDKKRVLLKL